MKAEEERTKLRHEMILSIISKKFFLIDLLALRLHKSKVDSFA
jgi:hypothetical protein